MKLSKALFSRLFIVGFAILAQLILFLLIISQLNDYFTLFSAFMNVISFVVVIAIINRDMITEAKIPWIIIALLMPVFGTVIYLTFSEYKLSRKQKRTHKAVVAHIEGYFADDDKNHFAVQAKTGKYKGQFEYIHTASGKDAYENTATKFFATGEDFWQSLTEDLKKAERYIFMEYFIVEDGVMWQSIFNILRDKAESGVEVRFMYDDLGSVNTLPWDFDRMMQKYGIICVKFNPFRPVISERHNNRDHRKITVVDGRVGYVGGVNIADEYVNAKERFGVWKDTAVRLEGTAVASLAALFLQGYDAQTEIVEEYGAYLGERYPANGSGVVMPYGDGPRPAYTEYIAENIYLNLINTAERYIWITTPYLIIDSKIENALKNAAMRGVDVRIVTPHIPDKKTIFALTRSYYKRLTDSGVKIFEFEPGFIHAKQTICDGDIAMVGTVNLDYRSLIHHYECGVLMYKTDCMADIKADFENLFSVSINMKDFRQRDIVTHFCRIVTAFTPLL